MTEPGFVSLLLRRPLAVLALAFVAAVILAAIFAPLVAPYGPNKVDLGHVLSGPSSAHLLGTDDLGRDVLSRLIYGGRVTLVGSAIGVGVALLVGVSAGLAAGYAGGWIDASVSWLADITFAIPAIMILLVVLSIFGRNEDVAMITFGLIVAPSLMRVVRGATLAVRHELFVDAARVLGCSRRQIIVRHIGPRISGAIVVQASLLAAGAVMTETGLGFLGLGVPPPTATWGGLVQTASTVVIVQPWLLVPTGLMVALTVLAFGLLGDAVRDANAQRWQAPATRSTRRPARRPALAAPDDPSVQDADPRPREGALLSVVDLVVDLPGGVRVVDQVSFDIEPGETVGVVGESGCGKTMTALALLALLPGGAQVQGGRCWFGGRDLAQLSQREMRRIRGADIGFVSQNAIASLDPVFQVGSQLAEVVRLVDPDLSRQGVCARVLELLAMVRLPDPEDVARRYPHELSGGMAQRVTIAAALAGRPRLLIADEPTTALDVTVQAEVLELLSMLQQENGMAILLITHDWGVVARMCRRALVMYAGQVVEWADVSEVFQQPLHPYTEGLLQSNPQRGHDREPLTAIPGMVPAPGRWPEACRFHPRCRYAAAECQAGAVPLLEPESARLTRCIRSDQLRTEAAVR